MHELLRTNDMALIAYVEALLREGGIRFMLVDQNMSIIEGSLGILPRRVLVAQGDLARARGLVQAAGIGAELTGTGASGSQPS